MQIAHENNAATGSHRFERLAECGGYDLTWLLRFMWSLYAHTRYVCKVEKILPAKHSFIYGVCDEWCKAVPLAVRLIPEPLLPDELTLLPCAVNSAFIPCLL